MKAPADVAGHPVSGNLRMTARVSEKVAVSVVFVAAMFMSIMDTTIVNVALPTIGRDFSVSPTAVNSVSIAFLVSLAVFIPASGWLGDRFGGKRVLLTAIAVFSVASALCGQASSLGELVAFRVLQGAGGGMLAPVGMAMLFRVFPPSERIRASSILTVPTTLAPALGPVLGGLLVTDLSWRWATGKASTMFNAARQVGGAIGVALLTTAIVAIGTTHLVAGHQVASLTAYRIAFLIAAAFCLAGVASALSIHDADAAATIPSRRHHPQWPASAVARVWHHPAATPAPTQVQGPARHPVGGSRPGRD